VSLSNAPFLLSRILQAIPVLFGVSLAVFLMVHLIPGDPAALIAGTDATRADVENVRQSLGSTGRCRRNMRASSAAR
jgi:ABC-type dipeptide/oligopeptide/nickel transport system permease component